MTVSDRVSRGTGPWPDGLVTRHEGSYDVAESFLSDLINLDVTDYGVLVQRPGFIRFHDAWTDGWPANFTNSGPFRLLGSCPSAIVGGNLRLYVSLLINTGGSWKERVYYTDDPTTGSPTQLFQNDHGASKPGDNKLFSQAVLYNGKIYFIRRSQASAGAFINNVVMDNGDTTGATAVGSGGSQAFGYYAFMMQDRLFVVDMNGSRVNYSKATDPITWAAPDGGFFDVNPQDAQQMTAVIALEDIVYLFKEDSTWAFTFNTDPTVDGVLRQVNKTYGALDATKQGSDIYVVNRNGIYRFIDGEFLDIADNINTIVDAPDSWTQSSCITIVGNRLIVGGVFESGSFTGLCMNIVTGAWTKYAPADIVISANSKRSYPVSNATGKTFMVWGDTPSAVVDTVINSGGGYFSMMRVGRDIADPDNQSRDQDRAGLTWSPRYLAVTVPLALDNPTRFKKLYRWRYNFQQFDTDNQDAKPTFSVREGDPTIVDDSQALSVYADYYTNFYDSVLTKQARFKLLQFGIDKALTQVDVAIAGTGVAKRTTFRVRGLTMDYTIRGLIRT